MATQITNNMMRSISKLAIVFLFLSCGSAVSQQSVNSGTVARNYGFVSPNTREDLKLEDAIRGMSSPEEFNLLKRAKNLGCVLKRKITTSRALGSWSDGAEHSILLRMNTDESSLRYLMSRLGRDANQKSVLYFRPEPKGVATIYVVRPQRRFRSLSTITRILDTAGVAFRTLVPTKETTLVYVVDTENNLGEKVRNAVKRLRARFSAQRGNASFIGDDAVRDKGQAVFEQEIKDYEAKHPNLPPPCVSN